MSFEGCAGLPRTVYVSDDTRFKVHTDGVVTVKRPVHLHRPELSFLIHAWDATHRKLSTKVILKVSAHHHHHHHRHVSWRVSEVHVVLVCCLIQVSQPWHCSHLGLDNFCGDYGDVLCAL